MKKTKKSDKISKTVNAVINEYRKGSPKCDPLGMYTGITESETVGAVLNSPSASTVPASVSDDNRPTQDADDL